MQNMGMPGMKGVISEVKEVKIRAKTGIGIKVDNGSVVAGGGIIAVSASDQSRDMQMPGIKKVTDQANFIPRKSINPPFIGGIFCKKAEKIISPSEARGKHLKKGQADFGSNLDCKECDFLCLN